MTSCVILERAHERPLSELMLDPKWRLGHEFCTCEITTYIMATSGHMLAEDMVHAVSGAESASYPCTSSSRASHVLPSQLPVQALPSACALSQLLPLAWARSF